MEQTPVGPGAFSGQIVIRLARPVSSSALEVSSGTIAPGLDDYSYTPVVCIVGNHSLTFTEDSPARRSQYSGSISARRPPATTSRGKSGLAIRFRFARSARGTPETQHPSRQSLARATASISSCAREVGEPSSPVGLTRYAILGRRSELRPTHPPTTSGCKDRQAKQAAPISVLEDLTFASRRVWSALRRGVDR